MPQDVYVDLLFLINFSMDYLCLYICTKILHRKIKTLKIIIAAVLGGIYSSIAIFLPLNNLISLIADIAVCFAMCAICFCEKKRPLYSIIPCAFLYVGISMMTGGCMTAIFNVLNRFPLPADTIESDNISAYVFAAVAAVAGIISLRHSSFLSRRSTVSECKIEIFMDEKSITLFAIADSGNLVKDPISGKNVILVDKNHLSDIVDIPSIEQFSNGKISQRSPKGIRLIPINTAAGKSVLAAFPPDKITLFYDKNGKAKQTQVDSLIAPSEIGKSAEGYGAVVPLEIIKF